MLIEGKRERDEDIQPLELRKLRQLDNDALIDEIPALLLMMRAAPKELMWMLLSQLDILTLYRLCRLNSEFYELCNTYRGEGIWVNYFHAQIGNKRRVEWFVQALRPVLLEPTLYGEPESPANWLWVTLAWHAVEQLDVAERDFIVRGRGGAKMRHTIVMILPRGIMAEGVSKRGQHIKITTRRYKGANPVSKAEYEADWRYDPNDSRNHNTGVNVTFEYNTFLPKEVSAKIDAYIYKYTPIQNIGDRWSYGFQRAWLTYDRNDVARLLYAMLRDGFAYMEPRTTTEMGERATYYPIRAKEPESRNDEPGPWDF